MKLRFISLVALMLIGSPVVHAEEVPAKAAACAACHGKGGGAPIMGSYPKINGQNKEYLVSAMKDYRDGKRTGAMSMVMKAQMAAFTDQDIEVVADYFAAQK